MVNMKKVLQFITLLICIFVIPLVVNAEPVESELTKKAEGISQFEVGKLQITNVSYTSYSNMYSTGKAGITVSGIVKNEYVRNVEVEVTLTLYDKNKNVLAKRIALVNVNAKDKTNYREKIFIDEISFSFDSIKYYSLTTNILSDVEILDEGQKDNYYLENYKVTVNVRDNNVYEVKESFDAVFSSNIEVLTKGIPYRHRYVREDGTKVNKRAIISDIIIDDYYKLKTEKGIRYINVGKLDKTTNKKSYLFNYKYNVGEDTLKKNDEFVFYISNNITVKTDGITFRIVMPKNFDKKNIKFIDSNGIEIDNVTYNVNGRVISGTINGVINPGVNYAISVLLEDGYFTNCSSNISKYTLGSLLIPILFLIISIIIWVVYKNSKKKVVHNSIHFNEQLNSLEIGYLYNGKVKDNDIASLLFCLANKGYIDIEVNKKSYKIIKKKEYEENDRVEKAFMKELFFAKDIITKKDLMESLTDMKDAISIKLEKSKKEKRLFARKVLNNKLLFWIFVGIIIILNTVNILIEYQPGVIMFNCIASVVGYILLLNSILSKNKGIEKVLFSLVALILIVSPIVLTSYGAFLESTLYLVIYIMGIIIALLIACIASTLSDRTRYGNKMLNKINAYKTYLLTCKNAVIEKELRENKNSIYEVLPYTLVLGVADRWIDKYREKELEKPEWYISEEFKLSEFYTDIMNIYSDIFIALKNNRSNE